MYNITDLTCRVCLQEQNILINIYDELEDLHTNLRNLLQTCADLQIDDNDIFPKFICEECTRELLIASKFREKCDKSKEILDAILEHNQANESCDLTLISDDIIEYSVDDMDNNEMPGLIIEEKEEGILPVNENELMNDDKKSFIQTDSSVSLLKKSDAEGYDKDLINPYDVQLQFVDMNSIIVEDKSNEFESVVECYTENEDSTSLGEAATETSTSFTNNQSKSFDEKIKKPDLVYKCDICGALFKQAFNLQKHLQKSHDSINSFSCAKCCHWFSQEAELFKHTENCNYEPNDKDNNEENKKTKADKILRLNWEQDTNRKCIYCEKEFPTPFALRMHVRTHTGERPFQCKFCTKSFKTHSQLNVHHKRHTGQADFACSICYKAFYEQSNLTVHMRSHTGERPHICTICNKTFTRVFLLQFHMRTHTGEKPFKCTYCDKNFRQATDLRSHLTIHTGQKQHVCVLCGKSYIKRSHLMQHMRKHNISSEDMESSEILNGDQTEAIEEFSKTTISDIQGLVQNSEILDSFEEIIERDDTELQAVDCR